MGAARRNGVIIVGIVFLVGINIFGGKQSIGLYLGHVGDAPINVIETDVSSHAELHKLEPSDATEEPELSLQDESNTNIPHYENALSPACKPHFLIANRPNEPLKWSNFSKFKRLYFHHARKAGE